MIEKVQAKLSSWKSKLLSLAGRVVLIQSVTSAIPTYYMQNAAFPKRICSDLDKLNRNFLWDTTVERKKMHMVGWVKICKPKGDGGLRLYATKPRNKALLAKLNWRLHDEKDSLWARTISAKYSLMGPSRSVCLSSVVVLILRQGSRLVVRFLLMGYVGWLIMGGISHFGMISGLGILLLGNWFMGLLSLERRL